MKILVVDHNAVDPLSQSLYREVARDGDCTIRILVPETWFDNFGMRRGIAVPRAGNVEVIPLPVWPRTRTHRMVYGGVGRQINEFRPDILFVNSEPENFSTFAVILTAGSRPLPRLVFSTWRNIDYSRGGFPYRLSGVHALIERAVLRRADHAIAFTADALPIFARRGFTRMTYVPPAVDTAAFSPRARTGVTMAGTFTVGFAGRLHELKGVDILLGAVAGLPGYFRLLVVGSGPEERKLRMQASSLGIDSRVEWRNPVPRTGMPDVLREMDVLVLPSRTGTGWKEQFGRVVVEAMACGVPVIASDSGSLPSVVRDAGIIVPEGDIAGFRGALLTVRNAPQQRAAYIERGLARARSEFAVPPVAERFRGLMKSLLSKTSHSLEV